MGGGQERVRWGCLDRIKMCYIRVWTCHNETHHCVYLIYANRNLKNKRKLDEERKQLSGLGA